jgi:hypothetical protein|tara:strand:+ start:10537 stop:10764 length:228 start_codon:yes stop_codon:yes gene_type:complete
LIHCSLNGVIIFNDIIIMSWKIQKGNNEGSISWAFSIKSGQKLSGKLKEIEKDSRKGNYPRRIKPSSIKRCFMGG